MFLGPGRWAILASFLWADLESPPGRTEQAGSRIPIICDDQDRFHHETPDPDPDPDPDQMCISSIRCLRSEETPPVSREREEILGI